MNTGLKRLEENLNVSENKLAMAISETKIKVSIPFLVRLKDLYFGLCLALVSGICQPQLSNHLQGTLNKA